MYHYFVVIGEVRANFGDAPSSALSLTGLSFLSSSITTYWAISLPLDAQKCLWATFCYIDETENV